MRHEKIKFRTFPVRSKTSGDDESYMKTLGLKFEEIFFESLVSTKKITLEKVGDND